MKKLTLALTSALMLPLILIAMGTATAFAQGDAKAKADQVLKQARAAIGSESKLKALQTLSASGTVRSTFGQFQSENTLEIEMMMPDKIKKTTDGQRGTNILALNGSTIWQDNIAPVGGGGFGGPGGPGGGGTRVNIGGPGGPGGMGANSPMAIYRQQQNRREMLQLMIGLVLAAPESAQIQYTYLAEAPGPEGSKLDVIEGKGAENFTVRLYIDQQSHQLIGMSYKGKSMAQAFRRGGQGGPGGPAPAGQGGQTNRPPQATTPPTAGGQGQPQGQGQRQGEQAQGQRQQRPQQTPEEMEKRMKEMADAFEKSPDVDFRWAISDYKNVGGLNLPHRLTKSEAGTPNEEWEISKYKVNPKLAADKFEKKEKEKAAN